MHLLWARDDKNVVFSLPLVFRFVVFLDSFPKYLVARVKDKSCLIVKFYYKENSMNMPSSIFAYVSRILGMEMLW